MTTAPKWALTVLSAACLATAASAFPAHKASSGRKTRVASVSRIERSLAGVRIGTRATMIVKMFGNPVVQLGAGGGTDASGNPIDGGGGFGSAPGGGGFGGAPTPGVSPFPGGPLPPVGGPSPFPSPGGGTPDAGGTDQNAGPAVTLTYLPPKFRNIKGLQMDIQVDEDGRVIQVIGTSLNPCGVHTSRGIGFGDSYARVLAVYGWPESHTMNGTYIQASYQESAHVAFQFVNNKVVRIVVAEVG